MTLTTVRDGLATRLDTISGLRVYATPPDSVQELPAAIVSFRSPVSTYDHVIGAADATFRFEVLLLVGSADEGQAQQDVEPYMSPTGASSVKGAVDGTLGGNADWARAGQGTPLARLAFPEKLGSHYWGTKFPVDVYESGQTASVRRLFPGEYRPHRSDPSGVFEEHILSKYNATGTSYVEVDDSGGTPRDLSPYADFIDFCGRDFYDPTVSVKEIVVQGPWDDKATTGSDAVLAGILGTVVTVSFGPGGNGSGARKITGEWTFSDYSIHSRAAGRLSQVQVDRGEGMVRYTAVFQISTGFSMTTWP